MTIKTKKLLDEMTDALFEKKAVLLTGNTGVGKTYLAKKISEKLVERKYSCFPSSKDQTVNVEIISCHNSVTYEEIVGGITADTDSGKMFFEYKDKIFLETIIRAAVDYNEGKGTKYVLIMDDLQRNDVSTLIGDAVNAIGLEGEEEKLCLNSGMIVEIPPNFYIIGTYNAAETGAILLPSDLISKFYVREILSEIEYITEDLETENAVYYDQVRSLVLNYLDMQYRRSTYDQSRYFLGHGYFSGNNVSLKIRYQLIPILKQYISEGILDSAAEESVHLLETACIKKKVVVGKNVQKSIYSEYRCGVTAAQFIHEDSTRKCSSIPIENLVGRIIDQQLLSDEKIKHAILFNKKVCYREMEVGGVTYQATTGYILPYAISMEKLFEVYVRAYFKKNGIASYRSKSNTGIRLEKYDNKTDVFLEEEGLENPGKYISGSIKPDLILTDQESGETMVLDVKYKDYRNGDSRDDRLQLLAYSMMMNANNIGIILPAQDEVEIFDARRINSMENRVVKYHQMLLGVMKDNPVIANYIKTNAFKKKE